MTSGNFDELCDDSRASEDAMQEHAKALYELVCEYMDDSELDELAMTQLLTDVALRMRMVGYGMEAEKPTAAGLKLDLDRYRRELDELIGDCKKGAEDFIEKVQEFRDSSVLGEDVEDASRS
jgi:hypothetical protein